MLVYQRVFFSCGPIFPLLCGLNVKMLFNKWNEQKINIYIYIHLYVTIMFQNKQPKKRKEPFSLFSRFGSRQPGSEFFDPETIREKEEKAYRRGCHRWPPCQGECKKVGSSGPFNSTYRGEKTSFIRPFIRGYNSIYD